MVTCLHVQVMGRSRSNRYREKQAHCIQGTYRNAIIWNMGGTVNYTCPFLTIYTQNKISLLMTITDLSQSEAVVKSVISNTSESCRQTTQHIHMTAQVNYVTWFADSTTCTLAMDGKVIIQWNSWSYLVINRISIAMLNCL